MILVQDKNLLEAAPGLVYRKLQKLLPPRGRDAALEYHEAVQNSLVYLLTHKVYDSLGY